MDLNELAVFARVAQMGSFTAAATALGMPKSTVSRKVSELETRLGARLLQRTTRKLSLTDAGRTYYEYCARIVSEVDDAARAVSSLQEVPRGVLRVTAPVNVSFLGPIVSDYLKRYPEVRLDLLCTARSVDLVEERYDVGIRAGALADSSLIARSIGTVQWLLVAAPAYLKRRGRPRSPDDLERHDCVLFGQGLEDASVRLERDGAVKRVRLAARMVSTDNDVLYAAARGGVGITLLPGFLCAGDLRSRRLERVIPDWRVASTPVHVVYPSMRHVSPKVRTFVDHLQKRMTPSPWEIK